MAWRATRRFIPAPWLPTGARQGGVLLGPPPPPVLPPAPLEPEPPAPPGDERAEEILEQTAAVHARLLDAVRVQKADAHGVEEKLRYVCLNEVVIDRGASAALVDLDVNIDGSPMTKVLADGVMISTPTGSTAYSLAAGGSMVHPGVSGVLFVPICPHTLSFRPLVLPDTSVLTVRVPESARVEPVASFDGKRQRTLRRGESLVIAGWRYPVPAICKSGETGDWFRAVKDSLLWNVRGAAQKPERHVRA